MRAAAFGLGLALTCACGSDSSSDSSAADIQGALSSSKDAQPTTLAETYLFADGDPAMPAAALVPYDVRVPLWSDGAHKSRYIFVPPGAKIRHDRGSGNFGFPVGTTLVKFFAADEAGDVPIEVRVITLKDDEKWYYNTYVWSEDGREVVKNERPRTVTHDGIEYRIPSEKECKGCHSDTRPVLGFNVRQVRDIDRLKQAESFIEDVAGAAAEPNLSSPSDVALPINLRARTYLDVNCSPCHFPGGPEKANKLDFRLDAIDTRLVAEEKIVPGDPAGSLLWSRLTAGETDNRMPPISLRADPEAQSILEQYIREWPH